MDSNFGIYFSLYVAVFTVYTKKTLHFISLDYYQSKSKITTAFKRSLLKLEALKKYSEMLLFKVIIPDW